MATDATWFVKSLQGEMVYGPYTLEQIHEAFRVGKLNPKLLVSRNQSTWIEMEEFVWNTDPQQQQKYTELDTLVESDEMAGKLFGTYHLIEKLGRGGMGVVYKAKDNRLERIVALKILLHRDWLDDENELRRFHREARLTAQLEHPHIVKMFETGDTPRAFLAMEYIKGQPLNEIVDEKALTVRQSAELFSKMCGAIEYAHKKKIIHRDIKPNNVLISGKGEPKILDFGLARSLQSSNLTQISHTGQFVGTPKYAAPEQVAGKKVNQQADIYSLGAVFYEMLTGRAPFEGDTVMNILSQLVSKEPVPPRKLNPDIPLDLELICLKCLSKDSQKRYRTVAFLRRDMEKFLDQRPISLRPPGIWERASKWIEENKVVSAMGAVITVALIVALVLLQRTLSLQKHMVSKAYQNACDSFYNKDLDKAQKKFTESIQYDDYRPYWMRGVIEFVKKDYLKAERDLRHVLEEIVQPRERCKIYLLLAMCAAEQSKIPGKWKQAQNWCRKAQKEYNWPEPSSLQGYPKVLDQQNCRPEYLNFQLPLDDRSVEKARYHTILKFLPASLAKKSYDEHFDYKDKNKENMIANDLQDGLERDLYKIDYLLSDKTEPWITAFKNHLGYKFAEIKEMIFYIKKKWILNMASPYWANLPYSQQREYAGKYQQEYARQLGVNTTVTRRYDEKTVFEMAFIPPGQFFMGEGERKNIFSDIGPKHPAALTQPFWMCTTEVTRAQWKAVEKNSPRPEEKDPKIKYTPTGDNAPQTWLFRNQVDSFLAKLALKIKKNLKLPHEYEWEYACRAGYTHSWILTEDARKYHLRYDKNKKLLWYESNVENPRITQSVGNTIQNSWGLYDMHGNAIELCSNRYFLYTPRRVVDMERLKYEKGVLRKGGYVGSTLSFCRASMRIKVSGNYRNPYVGFRFIEKFSQVK